MALSSNLATKVSFWGARGGHGATTIAGAMASVLGLPADSHDATAFEWMWGKVDQAWNPGTRRIVDAGVALSSHIGNDLKVVVVRGPCSIAVRTLAPIAASIDHLVLIREPWRSLRRQDVEAALSTPVAAEVPHSPRVARLADAGLLPERVHELDEFAELKNWATRTWAGAAQAARPLTF